MAQVTVTQWSTSACWDIALSAHRSVSVNRTTGGLERHPSVSVSTLDKQCCCATLSTQRELFAVFFFLHRSKNIYFQPDHHKIYFFFFYDKFNHRFHLRPPPQPSHAATRATQATGEPTAASSTSMMSSTSPATEVTSSAGALGLSAALMDSGAARYLSAKVTNMSVDAATGL